MKRSVRLGSGVLAGLLLGACAGGGGGGGGEGEDASPLQITTFTPTISGEGDVDLALAFSNTSRRELKSVELRLAAYDVGGNRASSALADKTVTLNGPYAAGKSSGPIALKAVWVASDIRCLELSQVKVTYLDYSIQIISGPAANQLVASGSRRTCHLAAGE